MSQLESPDSVEVGRRLGYDYYRSTRLQAHDAWPASVIEGFEHARARRLPRESADRYVRKWLQLRLGAQQRGRVVADDVTPQLLQRIDLERCPVTREPLTRGERADSDWSLDRLNNDGAYARNNLAVMSTRANRAKGSRSYEQVLALSEGGQESDGLQPMQWLRLAALMLGPCFATRPHEAPCIPLAAAIPMYSVRPAVQQIQHVFTTLAKPQSGKNRLIREFKRACIDESAQTRLRTLAELVHAGLKGLEYPHDVWLAPGVMAAFVAWRSAMHADAWALAGEISRRLTNGRIVPASRLHGWRLETRGYVA